MRDGRNLRYEYREIKKGRPTIYTCFSDLAAELGVGRGAVAGKFRRSKDGTIKIKERMFTRQRKANENPITER